MSRRTLYFCAGFLCVTIGISLFVYNQIVRPLVSYTYVYLTSAKPAPSPEATPETLSTAPAAAPPAESTTATEPIPQRREAPRAEARVQQLPTPEIRIVEQPTPLPTLEPTPPPQYTPPPRVEPTPAPDRLSSRECTELIDVLDRGGYVYVPPECRDHYNAWRRLKADRDRDERNAQRDKERQERAERQREQQDQRQRDKEKKQQQDQMEKAGRSIRDIIREVRRKP
jgi:hypothetical protein